MAGRNRMGGGGVTFRKSATRSKPKGEALSAQAENPLERSPQVPDVAQEQGADDRENGATSSDDEDSHKPKHAAYHALLAMYGQSLELDEPTHKKRKLNGSSPSHQFEQRSRRIEEPRHRNGHSEGLIERSENENPISEESHAEVQNDEQSDTDDDDENDGLDPFQLHFASPVDGTLNSAVNAVKASSWQSEKHNFGAAGRCTVLTVAGASTPSHPKNGIKSITDLRLKGKLFDPALKIFADLGGSERALAQPLAHYQDILFGGRTVQDAPRLRSLMTLHVLNHILKTRGRIMKNNARLAKKSGAEDVEYRDQGFTRPKVLVLLPTRNSCARYVQSIAEILRPEQQENKKRFEESYVAENSNIPINATEDYEELFGGNNDDMFRIGLKFTRKTIQLFSPFYNSDIIIASPLGLRRAIESPKPSEDGKKRDIDYDFLSSIEILLMDHADALVMQNWDHVDFIFDHLNLQPRDAHGCDFSRVRNWYLDNHAQHLRQTIILSAFLTPELLTLFSKRMLNISGKLKYAPDYAGELTRLGLAGLEIKQTFSRFASPSIAADADKRFEYFTAAVLPSLTRYPKPPDGAHGILIFIPSYFDFVRVRNHLAKAPAARDLSVGALHENAGPADAALRRARTHFQNGRHDVLLYTGRAHHFFRYKLRGVKKIVFYALPDNPVFYGEIVGDFLEDSINTGKIAQSEASVRVQFSRYDALKLERVVGSKRVRALVGEKSGDTFEFL